MRAVIAGATSGMVMAGVSIPVVAMILFAIVRDGSPRFKAFFGRTSPATVMMMFMVLAFPVWSIVGAVMGLLYSASVEAVPGSGIGSSNLVYTVGVAIAVALLAAPPLLLIKRFTVGLLLMALAFAGIFGWFLPLFAA